MNDLHTFLSPEALASLKADQFRIRAKTENANTFPANCLADENNNPLPFHKAQQLIWDSTQRMIIMSAGSQSGKELDIATPIPTPAGFKTMGSLEVGDIVYCSDGSETTVTYISPIWDDHICYRLTFDDGNTIIAGEDHLWIVRDYRRRKNDIRRVKVRSTRQKVWPPHSMPTITGTVIKTTKELTECIIDKHGGSNWSIDVSKPIYGRKLDCPIAPYFLGSWLSNGDSDNPIITCMDTEVINKIVGDGYSLTKTYIDKRGNLAKRYSFSNGDGSKLKPIMKSLNLINNKHIPQLYMRADEETRRLLVAGMLDGDGYCNDKGQAEYYTTRKNLADDFVELVCSLGYKARLRQKTVKLYGSLSKKNGEPYGYVYTIVVASSVPLFYLERKRNGHIPFSKPNCGLRYITKIEKIPSVPTRCISVNSPDHTYLVGRSFIMTHNTSFGPWWLSREIKQRGSGDYIAVTASYDLFRLKMLPAMLQVFEQILGIGRYWVGDKVIEIADPETGDFLAKRSSDHMWARIILRSADALGGLESATAKGAWGDETGQPKFTLSAYKAVRRRLTLERGRMLMTTTLYDLGWFVSHIVDPILYTGTTHVMNLGGSEIDFTVSEKNNSAMVQFDSVINPRFSTEEFDEQKKLLSQEEFEMFFRGRKSSRRLLIYSCFDSSPGGNICDPFIIPDDWKRYIGIDFGGTHMAAVYLAENPDTKVLYAYREYLQGDETISNHVNYMLAGEPKMTRAVGGAKSEGQWRTEFGTHGLHVEKPPIDDVDLGISRVFTQLKTKGLVFFSTLNGLIDQAGTYRRKRDSSGDILDDIEAKDTYHFLDCIRYIVETIRPGSPLKMKIVSLGDIQIW